MQNYSEYSLDPNGKYNAYLRKSRADRDAELRGEADVLARHRAMLEELAEKLHIRISAWYCEVVSGDTIDARPEMQRLLSDIETGEWDGTLVVEVERLARGNTRDQGTVAETYKYSNTKIITPLKTYDPNDEYDEEYFEFGLYMARREYKTINRRLQRGRIRSVKEGKFIGSTAPYGYRKVKIAGNKGYTLEIIPDQAKVVTDIFKWYCHGILLQDGTQQRLGADAIARRLDSLGIAPPHDANWSKATITDMLRNPTYAGYVFFGRQKEIKSSSDGKIVKIRKNNPDYTVNKGLHPAIISDELFELTARTRQRNRKNTIPATQPLQNPLSGLVRCKKCGKLMTRLGANSKTPYAALKCPNRYCDNISSPLTLVEKEVLSFLQGWVISYDIEQRKSAKHPIQKEIDTKRDLVNKMESEVAGYKKQLEKAYDFLEQGTYTLDVFCSRRDSLQARINKIETGLENVKKEIDGLEKLRAEKEQFIPKIRNLLDTYETNSAEANNQILKEIIEYITYEKNSPNRKGQRDNANFVLEIFPQVPS